MGRAWEPFSVKDIRLEGLQRISAGTVFNYLPVQVGDRVDEGRSAEAIEALFRTGFFKDIRLMRDDETLVVQVVERPSIAEITFSGNRDIETEQLLESLKQIGFSEGRVFDRSVFDQVEQELRRNYFSLGKYGVKIEGTVTPLERNRVAVAFDIREGKASKIKQIVIVGNSVFDDDELLDLFSLSTGGLLSFLTKSNQYSKQKLAGDLETLRSYYLDRGFINFNIDSTQVSITPDKQDVYITVNVTEGNEFTVAGVELAGDLILAPEELFDQVVVRRGQVFSRQKLTETTKNLTDRLGGEGYAFANVNAVPEIDEPKQEVAITFFVDPGKRVYVRRLNFAGNSKTRDEVLRREMRQLEGGWISTSAVERSRVRLESLGYFEEVNVETPAVAGTTDQVDVNFAVKEQPSGNLLAGLGFSQSQGIVFNASISQENFLGTGNRVRFAFNNSDVTRTFRLGYLNPYWTINGISLGFDIYTEETDAAQANVSDYSLDEKGAGVTFGVPVTEFDTVNYGLAVERTDFKLGGDPSEEIIEFQEENGDSFDNVPVTVSWARDSRNRRIFPTEGSLSRLAGEVTVPGSDLTFYKTSARHQRFFPFFRRYTLVLDGEVGYGDGYGDTDGLPLINNFFAGGIRSVRGFEANTLGPRDSQNDPIGGNLKLVGSSELLLPVPFTKETKSVRLAAFIDAGNVYNTDEDVKLDQLRASAGLGATWLSPLGALTFSFAFPVKKESGDDTQPFQFTFGTSF
jgi:outer membrane protein insertion porin family